MNNSYTIGIDVGGTKMAFGLFNAEKTICGKSRIDTPQNMSPEQFFDAIIHESEQLCKAHGVTVTQLSGIGIGMPSFIRTDGYILKTSNIAALNHFHAGEYLKSKLPGVRFILDNDTHAAALAEYRHGAGRSYRDILFCVVGTGIASAPIIDGKLFRGSYGYSGESGHILATPGEGLLCGCGKRGCIMSYCSGSMIAKHVRSWIESGEESCMTRMVPSLGEISTHEIQKGFAVGDSLAVRAVRQMQHYLAIWFYDLYVFMNINCFVLGGGLLKMGDEFWDGVFLEFKSLNDGDEPVYFKKAELADDFGMIGANELLFDN